MNNIRNYSFAIVFGENVSTNVFKEKNILLFLQKKLKSKLKWYN